MSVLATIAQAAEATDLTAAELEAVAELDRTGFGLATAASR